MWKRKWVRWLVRTGLLLLVVGVAIPLIERAVRRHDGEKELQAVLARTDAEDPGWRLDSLLAEHDAAIPPEGESITSLVMSIHPKQPKVYRDWAESDSNWCNPPEFNRRPSAEDFGAAKAVRDACLDVIEPARRIRHLSRGGYSLAVSSNPLETGLPHCDRVRGVAALLLLDSQIRALSGEPDLAIESAHAVLKTAAGVGEPQTFIELLVRIATAVLTVTDLETVLGWTEPRHGLGELQAALIREASKSRFVSTLRGERALFDRMMENLDVGSLTLKELSGKKSSSDLGESVSFWYYRGHLPADRAKALGVFNALIEASRRPIHERFLELAVVDFPSADSPYLLTRTLFPAWNKVEASDRRILARLRCAAAALACERFRQARGHWPLDLGEIPNHFLDATPVDPFDGKPLRLRKTDDGIVIYSVGPDRVDDGGHLSYAMPQPGDDVGFRLWDPAQRSAPPLPKRDSP
jgi:hypothetical protein